MGGRKILKKISGSKVALSSKEFAFRPSFTFEFLKAYIKFCATEEFVFNLM